MKKINTSVNVIIFYNFLLVKKKHNDWILFLHSFMDYDLESKTFAAADLYSGSIFICPIQGSYGNGFSAQSLNK